MHTRYFSAVLLLAAGSLFAGTLPPVPPLPSPEQRAWQELELTMFLHFGVNTFTDREWGEGKEDPKIFTPVHLDANQWVRSAKEAGFKLMILTAKHHDGFCLWPSKFTEHSVKNAAWKEGKGDVVREFTDACHAAGMKVGLYLSPWDRHEPSYGTDAYNQHFTNQLAELLTSYGTVDEVWFDGACGEGPNGKKQVYDWPAFYGTIRALAPHAVIAIMGPDVRWVGNESGVARVGESSVHRADPKVHGREGEIWWPAECDVSIRPGWFYHASEDGQVKSLSHLLDIYFKSVGRNSVMLLNVPPNRDGLIAPPDAQRLREFGRAIHSLFAHDLACNQHVTASSQRDNDSSPANAVDGNPHTFWAASGDQPDATLTVEFAQPQTFNLVNLQEPFWFGERIQAYRLEAQSGTGPWQLLGRGTVVGSRNLVPVSKTTADRLRIVVESARDGAALTEISAYDSPLVPERPQPSLATHKPATASSVHSQGTTYGADRAVDGDLETRWATADGTRACWLEVDLGKPESFSRVTIAEFAPRIRRFRIEYRNAATDAWQTALEAEGKDARHTHAFPSVTARFVRLNILDATDSPTIWEFEVLPK